MVLCKDCVFVKPTPWWDFPNWFQRYRFAKCSHPSSSNGYPAVRLSDGSVDNPEPLYCDTVRNSPVESRCGEDARYFKPKVKS